MGCSAGGGGDFRVWADGYGWNLGASETGVEEIARTGGGFFAVGRAHGPTRCYTFGSPPESSLVSGGHLSESSSPRTPLSQPASLFSGRSLRASWLRTKSFVDPPGPLRCSFFACSSAEFVSFVSCCLRLFSPISSDHALFLATVPRLS